MRIQISEEAATDVRSAITYYSEQGADLAAAFLADFDSACDLIVERPEIGRPIGRGNRKVVLQRFPFILIYRQDTEHLRILAVGHQRRRPEYWKK
jgi:plasmid stabilization system protein ParE